MRHFSALLLIVLCQCQLPAQVDFKLEIFASGFSEPVDIAHTTDNRLFIVEKKGIIKIIDSTGQVLPTPFLDIDSKVIRSSGEQGLLGLAFHPNYAENGYFYVNYINNQGDTQISRFNVSSNNPNVADPNSELPMLTIDQPYANHNGGNLEFGADGYLYIGMGDGGSGGDPQQNAQNPKVLLGKMLRIDVDKGAPYGIPSDNPFINTQDTLDEIWALGLRNPWKFSFDRATGDLWIADVGQGSWEEINYIPANEAGGINFGWRCYEGHANYNTNGCGNRNNYTFPVYDYTNDGTATGCSTTGGYVYRGSRYPNLQGRYIYADYCSGRFWSLRPNGQGGWINENLLDAGNYNIVSFGEDQSGELYVAGISTGIIYHVVGATTGAREEALQIGNLTLAPNPAGDFIRISMDAVQEGMYQFRLLDATGRLLRTWQDHVETGFTKNISLKNLPKGLYLLQVQRKGQTLARKFQRQ